VSKFELNLLAHVATKRKSKREIEKEREKERERERERESTQADRYVYAGVQVSRDVYTCAHAWAHRYAMLSAKGI